MFEEGKSINEIAKERGVLSATIIGHFSKFAETGVLSMENLKRILPKEKLTIFEEQYEKEKPDGLNAWKATLPNEFEYIEIRLLLTYFENRK